MATFVTTLDSLPVQEFINLIKQAKCDTTYKYKVSIYSISDNTQDPRIIDNCDTLISPNDHPDLIAQMKLVLGYTAFTEKEEKALKDWFKNLTPDKKENLIKRLGIRGAIAMSRELSKWKAEEDITISSDIETTIPPVLTRPPSPASADGVGAKAALKDLSHVDEAGVFATDEAFGLLGKLKNDGYINAVIATRCLSLKQSMQTCIDRVRQLRGTFGNDGLINAAYARGEEAEKERLYSEYAEIGGEHFNPDKDVDVDTGRYRVASGSQINKLQDEAFGLIVTHKSKFSGD